MRQFGQRMPLLVWRDVVKSGNARLERMREMGFEEVAVIECDDLDELEADALAIAMNRAGEAAEWDFTRLGETMQSLIDDGRQLIDSVGFADFEVQPILPGGWTPPEAPADPPPTEPVVRPNETPGHVTCTFTKDDWERIRPAIEKWREKHPDTPPSDESAIAAVLAHWFKRQRN